MNKHLLFFNKAKYKGQWIKKSILFFFAFATVSMSAYAQPANDLCAGATPIIPSPQGTGCGTATFTLPFTTDGTTDSGVPAVCSTPGLDNWYTWTATSLALTFSSQTPGNPGFAVFASCADALAGNDIACLNTFAEGPVSGWSLGDNLILQVYDFDGSNSDIAFCLEEFTPPPPPSNNDCIDAEPLAVNSDLSCTNVTSGTIASATASGEDETSCSGTEDDDVWYSFVASATSHEIDLINVTNGTTDLYHSVWEGSCGSLTNLLCSDPNSSSISGLTIGNTYLLRVYSWTGTSGQTTTFDVCIGTLPPPPANNECAGAVAIDFVNNQSGSTTAASNVEALAACSGGGGGDFTCTGGTGAIDFGAGVWFVYTSTAAEEITVSTDNPGTTFDTEIQVFEGTCGALTCVGGDDDAGSVNLGSSSVFCFTTTASFAPVTYYIYIDGHSTASGNFELSMNSAPVPVEMQSFSGEKMENENKLKWMTASEENTEFHIVERSTNGMNWSEVTRVQAAGFSSVSNSYEAMDRKPAMQSYYRIKSLDFDGQYQYSDVISIARLGDSDQIHHVYPNPANSIINVDYSSSLNENIQVEIYTIDGQRVMQQNGINVNAGLNTINLDINMLNSGIYMLKTSGLNGTQVSRFVKN